MPLYSEMYYGIPKYAIIINFHKAIIAKKTKQRAKDLGLKQIAKRWETSSWTVCDSKQKREC